MLGPVDSGLGVGAGAERRRTGATSTGRACGCPWLVGTDLRRATAPLAPIEAGGGARWRGWARGGWYCGSKEREARLGRAMGRSEQRRTRAHEGEMAVVVNAEWGGLTAARRCEACDGRASRKIFLTEM